MDKKIIMLSAVVSIFTAVIIYNLYSIITVEQTVVENNLPSGVKDIVEKQITAEKNQPEIPRPAFASPLDRAGKRVTKKPFGVFVTPQNSPIQPEKFSGWHTGADFEIFPEELTADIPVRAVCDGKLEMKKYASGYGGVAVESCELDNQPVTVIYGHLKLASITKKTGASLPQGEEIGILGKAGSSETSGERKHLHLGIHKGSGMDIRGYVQNQSELSGWIDPCGLDSVCH